MRFLVDFATPYIGFFTYSRSYSITGTDYSPQTLIIYSLYLFNPLYFKLWLFDLADFIVWNIKDLQHQALKIYELLRCNVVNTYSITISQDISLQVQPARYQNQTGHDPRGYNPVTNQRHYTGRDLVSYRCQNRH